MFIIQQMDAKSKGFEKAWRSILFALEEKLTLFNEALNFEVFETPAYTYQFKMVSEPLSKKVMGVWSYAVLDMRLVVEVYHNKEEQTLIASPNFSYTHRNGGSNGHSVSDIGESNLRIIYSQKIENLQVEVSNYEVHQLVEDLHDMGKAYKPKLDEEEQKIYDAIRDVHVERRGELSQEEKRSISRVLDYYASRIDQWRNEKEHYLYDYRDINEFINKAKLFSHELSYY